MGLREASSDQTATSRRPAETRVPGTPRWLGTARGQRWMLRAIGALLAVGVGSCLLVGANRPADPRLVPVSAGAGLGGHSAATSRVPGFGQVGFRVISARRVGALRCALLADTPSRQEKGLMGRHDLAGYDAMAFRFPSDVVTQFYNKDVPIPLSVGWFDASGVFVGSADLEICADPCPTFGPNLAYRLALEVRKGGLRRLGVGPGSVVLVGGNCSPAT